MMFMIPSAIKKALLGAVVGGALTLSAGAQAAITPFSTDVGTSIDLGLAWQDANGAYVGRAGDATGLSLLALLEKRVDGTDPNSATQGYALASAADKARMDLAVALIIANHVGTTFYAYRDGADMMALSVYVTTGGPNGGAPSAINTIFDRTIAAQIVGLVDSPAPWPETNGYWCYTGPDCRDSSTTQFVVAGLAAVKGRLHLRAPLPIRRVWRSSTPRRPLPARPISATVSPASTLTAGLAISPTRTRKGTATTREGEQHPAADRLRHLDSTGRRRERQRPRRPGLPALDPQPVQL